MDRGGEITGDIKRRSLIHHKLKGFLRMLPSLKGISRQSLEGHTTFCGKSRVKKAFTKAPNVRRRDIN